MADPVVRRLGAGRDDDTSGDEVDARVDRPGGGDVGASAAEPPPDSGEPPEESLFDHEPVDPQAKAEDPSAYGVLGPPLSRSAPFYRGLLATAGALIALVIGLAVRQATSVLVLVLVAAFFAIGLNPIVELLIRHRFRRGWAVVTTTLVVLAVVGALGVVVGTVLREQVTRLIDNAPQLLGDLRRNSTIRRLDGRYHFITNLQHRLSNPQSVTKSFGGIWNIGLSLFTAAADVLIVVVLTVYFLGALPQLKRALFSLAPASRRERVGHLGDEILRRVGRYVVGAVGVALLAGTVSFLFLLVIGLSQYALPLAVLVALLDLVPLVGSILGASIVTVVGLATSLPLGIACVVFYVIYEVLEGYVIYPRVMRSSVDVPEYVTIVAVLMGGTVGGVIGALLALPIAAALLLLVREVWVRRQDLR